MESMLRQQARLELGDKYDEAAREAERFVKWVLARGYFKKRRVISGEGSAAQMVENCLASIVQTGDPQDGVKEYFKYLSSEYDQRLSHNKVASLDQLASENTSSLEGKVVSTVGSGLPLGGAASGLHLEQDQGETQPEWDRIARRYLKDDDERVLVETMANTGLGWRSTTRLLGWDMNRGNRTVARVRSRSRKEAYPHSRPL